MENLKRKTASQNNNHFITGGGEMGALMRAKDWTKNPVGTPESWPQSLKTTISIILHSKFPMFLWWGPELICFYNDAYRPSLGYDGKHPGILGMKAVDAWPEIWDVIKPLINQVLTEGEAVWSEDQLIPIFRNGKIEDVYWTFSYSPVYDEFGVASGILVICTETTEKVKSVIRLNQNKEEFQFAIEASELGTFDYNPLTNKFSGNERLKRWFGLKPDNDIALKDAIDAIDVNDRERVTSAIQKALDYNSSGIYDIEYKIIHPATGKETFVRAKGKTWFGEDKIAYRFNGTLQDITDKVISQNKIKESEERIRLATEAAELATWDLDLKNLKIIYSPRLLEIFGREKSFQMTHQNMRSQILQPDRTEIVEKAFDLALQTGVCMYETRILKPNNSVCWIRTQGKVFYDEDNRPAKILGTTKDITDEKQHERVLLESEQKFRLLAESMPQFIWTGDAQGNLNYFNKAVYKYSGLSIEEISGGGWLTIVHPDEREENIKQWTDSITNGTPFNFEHRFRRSDGEYRWQLSRAVPQRDASGEIQMWVGTSTDIQEIKEQEEQKDYFISMASHELKTPITSIKGYIQILQSMHKNSEDVFLTKSLSSVDRQIVKLTNLISDLLDLSKIKSGKLFLEKEEFEINYLVEEVTDEIKHINPDYKFILEKGEDVNVLGDRERISQVLINFLTNAVKYSPKSREVKVSSVVNNNQVLVSVEDSGIGINRNDHEKIFERFYRVEGKSEKTFPGFGIGLFIANEIIQRHNGTIGLKSEPGKGSVFSFSLPVS